IRVKGRWCRFVVSVGLTSGRREPLSIAECVAHRVLICLLIALEDRLPILPPAEVAEVFQRRVLHLGGKFSPQTVVTTAGHRRQRREHLGSLPPIAQEVPRAGFLGIGRRRKNPCISDPKLVCSCLLKRRDCRFRQWRLVLKADLVVLGPP